jgi:steroid 5-alpha reductase family enzyme
MIIAFQVVLLFMMVITFLAALEGTNKEIRTGHLAGCALCIVGFLVSIAI